MRYSTGSDNTKTDLADALMELTRKVNSFDEISVSRIAHQANVHRNTIYYHFHDIRDMILWTLHRDLCVETEDVRGFLLNYFARNDRFLHYAQYVLGTDSFLNKMRSEFLPLLERYCNNVPNMATKALVTETFAEELLVAFLLQDQPVRTMEITFDYVIPELLRHQLL